jgi:nucleotide-binding universal stress UspA family protein
MKKGTPVLKKIVVGYAGDRAGRDAVALAGLLASTLDARLTVVFPYHPLLTRSPGDAEQERVRAEVGALLSEAEQADRALGTASTRATQDTTECHWSSSSWPIHALHELADYEDAQLIVFGAARERLGDRLHVSLMERMVHGAPCAVAVAPAGYSERPARSLSRVGVGFSGSSEGRSAILLARELAGRSDGSLTVIAGAGLEPALASYAFASPALGDVEREIYEETEQTLSRTCAELSADDGVPIEHETIRGDPASVLVERSSELDLLVLGSRAYGPLRHVLLGSVSARVMREARCPVLVVPRGVAGGDGHTDEQPAGAAQRA